MLEIRTLSKSFRGRPALKDFSFSFEEKVYGLLGPNGAGKTTLLRCLVKQYPIKKDCIFWNGKSIHETVDYLDDVGYLPQEFGLLSDLSVRDMLLLLANLRHMKGAQAEQRVEDVLAQVHLEERAEDKIRTLSGGMVRRLGIAQVLLHDPRLLLFDEPTAGLDPQERIRYKNILSQVKKDRTVLISTHIVEDLENLCDEIAIIKDGGIAASGTCEQIKEFAAGKCYLVPKRESYDINGKYHTQRQYEQDGEPMLRILTRVSQEFPCVEPTLEDGYICVLKDI